MLQVLLFSLLTTSSAFTTHRYDTYDGFGNHRPSGSILDNIFTYENGNGRRPVQVYEYAKQYDGVVISDAYQGPVIDIDGDNRRIDVPNPYQWANRQVSQNVVAVTEPAKFFNRFENSDQHRKYVYTSNPNENNKSPVVQQGEEEVTNQMNSKKGHVSVPLISTQSDDVTATLVINEQQITWNNDHEGLSKDNANVTTRSINSDNNTNSLNVSDKQNDDNIKTSDSKYNTKTTEDNEVTPEPHEQRTKAYDDDRWVWSNGEEKIVKTTTSASLVNRAAFSGGECPLGKAKIGNICAVKD